MWGSSGGAGPARVACLALVAIAVAVLGACAPPSDPGSPPTTLVPLPEPPGEFDVLAYNVAGLPQGISGSNPEANLPRISPLLNAYDVVLTQEDFDWWQPPLSLLDFANYHRRLRADATHPYRSDRHPGPAAVGVDAGARGLLVGDGIGLMARYPLTDEGHLAWSECFGGILPPGSADCLAMKGARVMTMTLGDGHEVDLYSLHVEAGGTAEDQRLQAQDMEELAGFIETRSAGRAVILGGDTNLKVLADPDSLDGADAAIWSAFLARLGLTDVCVELDCELPNSIDKFAYRSGAGVTLAATGIDFPIERFSTPTGAPLSDHHPVVATFDWDAG